VRRAYRGDTLVLETEFETETGVAAVVDCMPPGVPEVVRVVEGRQGRVAMGMELIIRFDYGSLVPWVRRTADGWLADNLAVDGRLHEARELFERVLAVRQRRRAAGGGVRSTLTQAPGQLPPGPPTSASSTRPAT